MQIINVPRGYGKTNKLLKLAEENGYTIIVATLAKKNKLKEEILYNKYHRVSVYTAEEFIHGLNGARFSKNDKICIDDMDEVLQAIIGFDIVYATCSIPYDETPLQ
jgi:hypothetical protein